MLVAEKLSGAQARMKRLYDRYSEPGCFCPSEQVLAFLLVVGSPFQAKFTGSHLCWLMQVRCTVL